jgi:hypothetical protein
MIIYLCPLSSNSTIYYRGLKKASLGLRTRRWRASGRLASLRFQVPRSRFQVGQSVCHREPCPMRRDLMGDRRELLLRLRLPRPRNYQGLAMTPASGRSSMFQVPGSGSNIKRQTSNFKPVFSLSRQVENSPTCPSLPPWKKKKLIPHYDCSFYQTSNIFYG